MSPEDLDSSSDGEVVQQVGRLEVVEHVVHGEDVQNPAVDASVKKQVLLNSRHLKNITHE